MFVLLYGSGEIELLGRLDDDDDDDEKISS